MQLQQPWTIVFPLDFPLHHPSWRTCWTWRLKAPGPWDLALGCLSGDREDLGASTGYPDAARLNLPSFQCLQFTAGFKDGQGRRPQLVPSPHPRSPSPADGRVLHAETQGSPCSGFFLCNLRDMLSVSSIILQDAHLFLWTKSESHPFIFLARKASALAFGTCSTPLPQSQVAPKGELTLCIEFKVANCNSRTCWYAKYEALPLDSSHVKKLGFS